MRRPLVALALVALLILTPVAPAAAQTTAASNGCTIEDTLDEVLPSVFQLTTDNGTGTAFYVGDDTYVTASHVVAGVTTATARNHLHTRDLTVAGGDVLSDYAYLTGSGTDIEPLTIGDSTDLNLGASLIVAGYPGAAILGDGSRASVALGVLSDRSSDTENPYIAYLQTDAAVNPGNSGGPAMDACGNVVGLVTSKIVGLAVEGIGYALASSAFGEAKIRATEAGPPPELNDSPWYTHTFSDGAEVAYTFAFGHTYADFDRWADEYPNVPELVVYCGGVDPFVYMYWDVEELIGDSLAPWVNVSVQFDQQGWTREYWKGPNVVLEQDSVAVSPDSDAFLKAATDSGWVSMWLTGRNFVPIGMAEFNLLGMAEAMEEIGC